MNLSKFNNTSRLAWSVIVMALIIVVLFAATFNSLYTTSYNSNLERLNEAVNGQARLIESVAKFDALHSQDAHPEGSFGATLSQIAESQSKSSGIGDTGEFTLARLENESLVYLLPFRHKQGANSNRITPGNTRSTAMHQAALGHSGTMVGLDYRGVEVVAAYTHMKQLNLGLVAKMDLTEVRAPFIKAGVFVGVVGLTLIVIGGFLLVYFSQPVFRELEERERRFRDLIEWSIQGIAVVDSNAKPVFANQAFADIYGFGSPDDILTQGELTSFVHLEERARITGYAEKRIKGEAVPNRYEFKALRKDGSEIWLENVVTRVKWKGQDALQIASVEITNRKMAEEDLRDSESRFRNLIEGSIQGVIIHMNQQIQFANSALARIFGYADVDEVLALNTPLDLVMPSDHARLQEYGRKRMAGEEAPGFYQFQGRTKEGNAIWLEAAASKVEWEGTEAVLMSLTDVTERVTREEQNRQMQRLETVSKLADGTAHHFNNMMQIIRNYTEVILFSKDLTDKTRRALNNIQNTVDRSVGLTQQMLAFSNQQRFTPFPLDINSFVDSLENRLKEVLKEGQRLEIHKGEGVMELLADKNMLQSMLGNLVANASVAMADDGLVTIETAAFTPPKDFIKSNPWASAEQYVRLTVTDNGVGVAEDIREKIFDPFFTTKEVGQGVGLGLALVYGGVSQHSGHIQVESTPGLGATFSIHLPVRTKKSA